MTQQAIADALANLTNSEVARAADVSRSTVLNLRRSGVVPSGPKAQKLAATIARMSGVPLAHILADDPPAGAAPDFDDDEIDEFTAAAEKKKEEMLLTRARRIEKERENSVRAGELIETEEVRRRVAGVSAAMRAGSETIRRDVEAVCSKDCRRAVVAAVDAGFAALRDAVAEALRGG